MLSIDLTTLSVLLIVTLAAFVRATVGFGDALIAMSLLVCVIGLETATPLVGLTGVSTALLMLTLSWQKVDLRSIAPFLAASAIGIHGGALLLTRLDGDGLIIALGVVLVAFGIFKLTQPTLPALRHPILTFGLGLLSGLFGGAYNVSGPVAVLYGGLRRWSPEVVPGKSAGLLHLHQPAHRQLARRDGTVDRAGVAALRLGATSHRCRYFSGQPIR